MKKNKSKDGVTLNLGEAIANIIFTARTDEVCAADTDDLQGCRKYMTKTMRAVLIAPLAKRKLLNTVKRNPPNLCRVKLKTLTALIL